MVGSWCSLRRRLVSGHRFSGAVSDQIRAALAAGFRRTRTAAKAARLPCGTACLKACPDTNLVLRTLSSEPCLRRTLEFFRRTVEPHGFDRSGMLPYNKEFGPTPNISLHTRR